MIKTIVQLPRNFKQILMLFFDIFAIVGCIFSAFFLRLGEVYYPADYGGMLVIIYSAPLLALPIFYCYGLYSEVIRYVSFKALWSILKAVSLYAIIWGLIAFMAANWNVFPRSVILINWLTLLLTIVGSRLFVRWLLLSKNHDFFD